MRVRIDDLEATIGVNVADRALAEAIDDALTRALAVPTPPPCEVALVHVTRDIDLVARVDELRAAGATAIQLVWNGADRRLAKHVFAALERGRANPAAAPVVLARSEQPVAALRILVAHRRQT